MKPTLIHNATIVNENKELKGSVLVKDGYIEEIFTNQVPDEIKQNSIIIDAEGKILFPGVIDDQVHFREPGLTHKAEILTESKAAVAGGITSFMEMPNTKPQTTTIEKLEEKFGLAAKSSHANYSFYFGATNDNIEELKKVDPKHVCGVKVFMGSSTGNMLVDDEETLRSIFKESPVIITTHCEDEATVRNNLTSYRKKYGDEIPIKYHPAIRSAEACYLSSERAVRLAKEYDARLHILHISTGRELELFDNQQNRKDKKITAEACIHHLWFQEEDYEKYGTLIKWNPAVKTEQDREALIRGLKENKIDVIATDHAPHTKEEKANNYAKAPSGGPMVQHALLAMLDLYHNNTFSLSQIADKMCHAPADLFNIDRRGYIRKGYWADLVLVDPNQPYTVNEDNILYKCGWSPMEGHTFKSTISRTFVNGTLVYENGTVYETNAARRLEFSR